MPVTIPQTQLILQSYFQTGSEPTQDQFTELIGTMFFLYTIQQNAANAALAAANAALAQVQATCPVVFLNATFTGGPTPVATIVGTSQNVASVTFESLTSGFVTFRITFNTGFSYTANNVLLNSGANPSVVTVNNNYVDIKVQVGAGNFFLAIFP